jgi:hypothetical protein
MRNNTFTKGSGCYECKCCGHKTRDDGNGDSVHCELCTQCYEYAGVENTISDCGSSPELVTRLDELQREIVAKGGNRFFDSH